MADRKCGNEKTRNRMKAKQSHPILRVLFILERKKGQGLLRQTEEETPVHLTPPKSASPSCGTQACGAVQCHRIDRREDAGTNRRSMNANAGAVTVPTGARRDRSKTEGRRRENSLMDVGMLVQGRYLLWTIWGLL
eukprot:2029492-Rhodomonas_salina.1